MTINQLAGVYYTEEVTYELTGVGSKIPIFIGRTGNSETTYTLPKTNETVTYKVDGTQFHKFEGYSKVNQPIDKGGIGDKKIVANELDLASQTVCEPLTAVPIVLGQAVFDGDDCTIHLCN